MTHPQTRQDLTLRDCKGMPLVEVALAEPRGLLPLAYCWFVRSFLQSDAPVAGA